MSESDDCIVCTWNDESVCIDCKIGKDLNCRYDRTLASCFRNRNITYRVLAFLTVGLSSFFTGVWLLFVIFAVVTFLNFAVIETFYLCRHCPFYAAEGKTLHCVTLDGLPKPWKFNPSPISKSERAIMMLVGGFIDLFPVAAGVYGVWILFTAGSDILSIMMMATMTVIMFGAAGYLEKYIREGYCVKCI
ncbi:MAG: hypothetical protein RTU92_06190, partial [Candidatus Thorarchaeota archaeon]